MTAAVWIGVALLGAAGALSRFWIDGYVDRRTGGEFPFGTLTVNLVGSFVLGILRGADVGGNALLLTGTAALGSLTTFSTWMFETERLAEDGRSGLAVANIVGSLAAGLAAAILGWAIGKAI